MLVWTSYPVAEGRVPWLWLAVCSRMLSVHISLPWRLTGRQLLNYLQFLPPLWFRCMLSLQVQLTTGAESDCPQSLLRQTKVGLGSPSPAPHLLVRQFWRRLYSSSVPVGLFLCPHCMACGTLCRDQTLAPCSGSIWSLNPGLRKSLTTHSVLFM